MRRHVLRERKKEREKERPESATAATASPDNPDNIVRDFSDKKPSDDKVAQTSRLTKIASEIHALPFAKKALIVHETELIRCGVRHVMERSGRFEICGETDDARTARELFLHHRPEVVVLSLLLRDGDGVRLIKEFRKIDPAAAMLVVCARDDPGSVQRALHAGARAYLATSEGVAELLCALDSVLAGDRYVSAGLWPVVLEKFANGQNRAGASKMDKLSDRELEVFRLVGEGLGASDLANKMHISVKTIETHKMRIQQKLGLRSAAGLRKEAARLASTCPFRRSRAQRR